jgi:hypothetical protein
LLDRERLGTKRVGEQSAKALEVTQFRRHVGIVHAPDLSSERQVMMFGIVADDPNALKAQLQVFRESQLETMSEALTKTIERLAKIKKAFHPPQLPPKYSRGSGGGSWGGGGSAGAVFQLIASDGRADRLIMATRLLSERIRGIMASRGKLALLLSEVAGKIQTAADLVEDVRSVRKRLRIESCAHMLMKQRLPEELAGLVNEFAFKPRPCPPEPYLAS